MIPNTTPASLPPYVQFDVEPDGDDFVVTKHEKETDKQPSLVFQVYCPKIAEEIAEKGSNVIKTLMDMFKNATIKNTDEVKPKMKVVPEYDYPSSDVGEFIRLNAVKQKCDTDLKNWNGKAEANQWLYCHTRKEFNHNYHLEVGTMHKYDFIAGEIDFSVWRAATKDEIKEHYENIYGVKL